MPTATIYNAKTGEILRIVSGRTRKSLEAQAHDGEACCHERLDDCADSVDPATGQPVLGGRTRRRPE